MSDNMSDKWNIIQGDALKVPGAKPSSTFRASP